MRGFSRTETPGRYCDGARLCRKPRSNKRRWPGQCSAVSSRGYRRFGGRVGGDHCLARARSVCSGHGIRGDPAPRPALQERIARHPGEGHVPGGASGSGRNRDPDQPCLRRAAECKRFGRGQKADPYHPPAARRVHADRPPVPLAGAGPEEPRPSASSSPATAPTARSACRRSRPRAASPSPRTRSRPSTTACRAPPSRRAASITSCRRTRSPRS